MHSCVLEGYSDRTAIPSIVNTTPQVVQILSVPMVSVDHIADDALFGRRHSTGGLDRLTLQMSYAYLSCCEPMENVIYSVWEDDVHVL